MSRVGICAGVEFVVVATDACQKDRQDYGVDRLFLEGNADDPATRPEGVYEWLRAGPAGRMHQ